MVQNGVVGDVAESERIGQVSPALEADVGAGYAMLLVKAGKGATSPSALDVNEDAVDPVAVALVQSFESVRGRVASLR